MNEYSYSEDGSTAFGRMPDGSSFVVDSDIVPAIKNILFYYGRKGYPHRYPVDRNGKPLHYYILPQKNGFEVDHINLDTLDNRRSNLRYCTHQQNQINQPLQKNNTSGVTGVRWYRARGKFVARIKVNQHDIHLGYYMSFIEAVQARNVGMEYMFGEFGRYNDVPPAPDWIREKVRGICERFPDSFVIRDGEKLPCLDVYQPTDEDMAFREDRVNQ